MSEEIVVQPQPRAWLEESVLQPYVSRYGAHLRCRRYAASTQRVYLCCTVVSDDPRAHSALYGMDTDIRGRVLYRDCRIPAIQSEIVCAWDDGDLRGWCNRRALPGAGRQRGSATVGPFP